MKAISKKVLITLGVILTLGLCVGCDPLEDSSISSSEYSSSSSSETQYFEIKWVNYGNKLIYKEMVPEGQMPFYHGETPTRPDTEENTYVFTGWSPEVVPATADAKYKAQYEIKKRTFDVVFSGGNCTCRYSQTIIKDVPYGTKVHTDGAYIEINGVGVTVEATPTEGESLLHDYTFDRWSANDGEYIFRDTVISAYFNVTDKLFNLKFEAVGGGMLMDCARGTTDYSLDYPDGKAYSAYVDGGEIGQPVTGKFRLVTTINNERIYFELGTWSPYEDFYTYVFDGWYYNGETLKYGVDLTGDVLIEGHFHQEQLDYTYLFDFEINTATNDAAIVGVKEGYLDTQLDHLTIPRSYQGYPVAGIKNAALSNLSINHLAIPNTLIYIEEVESFSSSIKPNHRVYSSIVLEEGSTNFRMVDGVLYNYAMTEAITGTMEMQDYLTPSYKSFTLPSTVTHIWKCAFKYIAMDHVNLPEGLTIVPGEAFASTGLNTFDFSDSLTEIHERAFVGCHFSKLVLNRNITTLGSLAFGSNDRLRSVYFGAFFNNFFLDIFWNCPNIQAFTVSEVNEKYAAYKGALYNKDLTCLECYPTALATEDPVDNLSPSLTSITYSAFHLCTFTTLHLPEGVKRLENMAIYECADLEKVYLPSTITYLGGYCFQYCSNISYMEFAGTVEQFNAIGKDAYRPWNATLTKLPEVVCTNGTVPVSAKE